MPPEHEPTLPMVNLRLTSSKPPAPCPTPTSSAVTPSAVTPSAVTPSAVTSPAVTPGAPASPPLTSMLNITPHSLPANTDSTLSSLPPPSSPSGREEKQSLPKAIPHRRPKKRETFLDLQEILKERAGKFRQTLAYQDHLSRRNSNPYVALKQRIQPSSRSTPTYEARFSKPKKKPIQAEIFISSGTGAPSGKVPPKVDDNLKKCLTDVLEVFAAAKVPVVNVGGAWVDPSNPQQTYEILKNAIGSESEEGRRPIPVLNKYSILDSLLFCYRYEKSHAQLPNKQKPIHNYYAKLIFKNQSLREELESDLQPYKDRSKSIPDEELRFVESLLRRLEPPLSSAQASALFKLATQPPPSKTQATLPEQANNSDISARSQNISSDGKLGSEPSKKRSVVDMLPSFFNKKKKPTSEKAASCGNEARQKGQTSNASGVNISPSAGNN